MKMSEYIPEYEKHTGKPVAPAIVRFAEIVDRICERAENMGREDASKGENAFSTDAFRKWIEKTLRDDCQIVDIVTEFVCDAYLKGYSAGGEQYEG